MAGAATFLAFTLGALQEVPAPATGVEVRALLVELDEARRSLDYGPARERLAALSGRIQDDELALELAAGAGEFVAESALFDKLAHRVHEPELAMELLASLPLSAPERLELARFAFFRGLADRAEAQLRAALDAAPVLKEDVDHLLASARHEEMPRGGYAWHRGRFLPALEVNRRRLLEDVAQRVEQARPEGANLTLAEVESAPARALDLFAPRLEAVTSRIVAELAQRYEAPRDWIASYRRNASLRRQRLQQIEQWEPVAKSALELIARYDKPEQPKVDAFREQLAERALQYARLRQSDELGYERASPAEAEALLQRIEVLERALDGLLVYRREYHGGVPDPFPAVSPQGSKTHVLPGRTGAGLEEFALALLMARSNRTLPFIQRVEELERVGAELTRWERVVLRDHLADAIDRYDAKALTSATPEEFACHVATNEYRRTLLLRPCELDERVVVAARGHSQEMKDLDYFGHDSPTDKLRTPSDRVQVAGYGGGAGENCYAGGGGGRGAFESWYHSPGHHRNLVGGSPHLGCGADTTHTLWTQNFAGTDWGWRQHFPTLTVAEEAANAAAIERLARTKHDTCRDEVEALIELGAKVLPAMTRTLSVARADSNAERRGVATRLARATAVVAEQEAIPQASDFAIETLLALLEDPAGVVRGEANVALEQITAKSCGFGATLEPTQRAAAVKRWREWWKSARDSYVARFETKPEEIAPYDAASPAARGSIQRQSPDAPIKVFSPEERLALAKRLGGSRQTEQAVNAALDWLLRHQNPDGSWSGAAFEKHCHGPAGETCGGAASFDFDIALTGLSLLCLIHAGNTVEIGPHRERVRKGLDFLVSRMQEHGKFTTTSGWYMYQHALATQALAEGYGTSGDPFLKQAAQRAVDFLVFAQHPELGGWRYEARVDSDTSVTGWVVLALMTAHDAGLKVAGFKAAREWIERVTERAYYRVGYQSPLDGGTHEPRLTAVGIVCRQALGTPASHPSIVVAKGWLLRQLPTAPHIDLYFAYYATLALFQIGGDSWKTWNDAMAPALLERIHHPRDPKAGCRRGSFDSQGSHAEMGGRIYGTAISCLMLEVYYRYEKFPETRSFSVTGSVAEFAQPLLEKLGTAGSDVERAVAMRRLEEEFGSSVQQLLLAVVRDSEDLAARQDAAAVLARVASAALVGELLALLDLPDPVIQERLFKAVAHGASAECLPELTRRVAEDARAHVRRHAARTLGAIGRPEVLPKLIERGGLETDPGVKEAIGTAIRVLSNRSALDLLLDDAGFLATDPARRSDLRDGLSVLESNGLAEKLAAARTKQPALLAACLAPLKEQGRFGLVPLLIAALELEDPETRDLANQLLIALSGRNVDFPSHGDARLRKEGIARWTAWWKSARAAFSPPADSH